MCKLKLESKKDENQKQKTKKAISRNNTQRIRESAKVKFDGNLK